MLTRSTIQKMNEAALRKEVLIPLLRAMDYKDVYEYHGGAGEQGKDIVCWKLGALEDRENLALVVKATQMSGKARVDKGTAGEVQTQIRQCFGKAYLDPVSNDEREVHHVWVVSNQKISKEAMDAIKSAVDDDKIMRYVKFVDGDNLWSLVKRYLPTSLLQHTEELQNIVRNADSHYIPQITVDGNTTSIFIKEKFAGASDEKPISIKTHFANSDAAGQFHSLFQDFAKTGKPVDVPLNLIRNIEMPDFLNELLGTDSFDLQSLQMFTANSHQGLPVKITITCDDGDSYVLHHVLLKPLYAGTEEATLISINQDIPCQIKIVMLLKTKESTFTIDPLGVYNATLYYEYLKFRKCLSKKCGIHIETVENGIAVMKGRIQDKVGIPPSDGLVDLVEKLSEIQKRVKIPIVIPSRNFSQEEVQAILGVHEIVTAGRVEDTWENLKTEMHPDRDSLDRLLETFGSYPKYLMTIERDEDINILDVEINLGTARYSFYGVKLANIEDIRMRYDDILQNKEVVDLLFLPDGEAKVVTEYSKWLPEGDGTQ